MKLVFSALAVLCLLALVTPASAASVIKNPGDHPDYSVELEPHGLLLWHRSHFNDEGFGLGLRVNVSLMENGPIDKINNNMAIGFGLDYVWFDDPCREGRWWWRGGPRDRFIGWAGGDCSASALWFPVVLQWNFWLTDIISVFGEPGLAIEHFWWEVDCFGDPFCGPDGVWDESDTDLEFVFWGGARFMFGDTVGLTVRIGTPYMSVGASILF